MSFMYFLLFSIFVFDSLLDAFGNKTRIDYGTGDCFLMIWLPVMKLKIDKFHIVLANNYCSNAGFFSWEHFLMVFTMLCLAYLIL